MAVIKPADTIMRPMVESSISHIAMALFWIHEGNFFDENDAAYGEVHEAQVLLNRFISLGGQPEMYVESFACGVPVPSLYQELLGCLEENAQKLEYLGSLPVPAEAAERLFNALHVYYEQVTAMCKSVMAGQLSEDLANMQDDAQNAVEQAFLSVQNSFAEGAMPREEDLQDCAEEAAVASEMLKRIEQRVRMGEVPAREYPLDEDRWSQTEEMSSRMQKMFGEMHKKVREEGADPIGEKRLEALRHVCFMFAHLTNLRNARPDDKKAS